MNALAVHLLGVVVWTGGLIGLIVMRRSLGDDLGATVSRYSTVAAWCFAAVTVTGIQQAWIRLGSFDAITTSYGAVVALKTSPLRRRSSTIAPEGSRSTHAAAMSSRGMKRERSPVA